MSSFDCAPNPVRHHSHNSPPCLEQLPPVLKKHVVSLLAHNDAFALSIASTTMRSHLPLCFLRKRRIHVTARTDDQFTEVSTIFLPVKQRVHSFFISLSMADFDRDYKLIAYDPGPRNRDDVPFGGGQELAECSLSAGEVSTLSYLLPENVEDKIYTLWVRTSLSTPSRDITDSYTVLLYDDEKRSTCSLYTKLAEMRVIGKMASGNPMLSAIFFKTMCDIAKQHLDAQSPGSEISQLFQKYELPLTRESLQALSDIMEMEGFNSAARFSYLLSYFDA